uniref:Uncharacterized protein n=1 Tax=Caenorhabditis tropicalis TaxID=1561998 RepID=A0A1I7UCV6_9PELO
MLIIFVVILKLAWRFTKKEQRNQRQKGPLIDQKIYSNNSKNVYLSLPKYDEVNSLEAADQFSKKTKVIEEDSISRFTQISEVSEVSENIQLKENELKFFRPHLHV